MENFLEYKFKKMLIFAQKIRLGQNYRLPLIGRSMGTNPKATVQFPTENINKWTQNIGDFK